MRDFDDRAWAEAEAERLRSRLPELLREWDGLIPGGNAVASDLAPGLEFLRRAAPGSAFAHAAESLGPDQRTTGSTAIEQMAALLDQYMAARNSGLIQHQPFEVRARVEAATDLMEQVGTLLLDRAVHATAAVMLAGAALEELLRSMWVAVGSPKLDAKSPSINAYTIALKKAGQVSRQEETVIQSWAAMRNDAAHGHFESICLGSYVPALKKTAATIIEQCSLLVPG